MAKYEYRVAYMDFRGRISIEGEELFIEKEERRSTFARRVLDELGEDGWDLVAVQQLWPAETSYLIFKREKTAASSAGSKTERLPTDESGKARSGDIEPRGPVQDA